MENEPKKVGDVIRKWIDGLPESTKAAIDLPPVPPEVAPAVQGIIDHNQRIEEQRQRAEMEKRIRGENREKCRAAVEAILGPFQKCCSRQAAGNTDCPVCGAKLSLIFQRSGYDGELKMTCIHNDCVDWSGY